MASERRFAEVRKILEGAGFRLDRIAGSHHIFEKPGAPNFVVPVHRGKVLAVYVRKAQKLAATVARVAAEESVQGNPNDGPSEEE